MATLIFSQFGFLVLLSLFAIGAIGALILGKNDQLANVWSGACAIAGSVWGLVFGLFGLGAAYPLVFTVNVATLPLLSLAFTVDKLAALFLAVISVVALFCSIYGVGYAKHYYQRYNIGALGFLYNLFIVGMMLVVSSANGLLFLMAWEVMSIASYCLVVYDYHDEANVKAGFLYFVMTHIATACIALALALLFGYTGSFDFTVMAGNIGNVPTMVRDIVFLLALVGFGTKAGIIPLHIWLPDAHPAAPSHVSALMSGVMIKTGIYMLIRVFFYIFGGEVPLWWGVVVLAIATISSLLGVLYALTEHDIKRLLAYHSIENIGIILLGVGSAMIFVALKLPALAVLGLVAALFHVINHAIFKSLLFLSAGSVIMQTHTRNIDELGGLIKRMPQTALFFLVGAMAISGLPPFNGFFSEWLTFQSLFQGVAAFGHSAKWLFMLATGALALTSGLALACFVKAFGVIFLARPRSEEAIHAHESSSSLIAGMTGLATLCLMLGVFSGSVVTTLKSVVGEMGYFGSMSGVLAVTAGQQIEADNGFAAVSAPGMIFALLITMAAVVAVVRLWINREQRVHTGITWDCGTNLNSRMEITGTGFSRSIILVFKGFLKPTKESEVEYGRTGKYLPKSRTVILGVKDLYRDYLYGPVQSAFVWLSERTKMIQNGNVNLYILYIFLTMLVALLLLTL